MVLVHGTLDRAAGMLRVVRCLRGPAGGPEILRYDRRGYGRSAATGPATSFDQQVDDLAAVLDGRSAAAGPAAVDPPAGRSPQPSPAVVFGHSYGGVIALALAARRHPGVGAVVSYEAPRAWEAWWTPPPAPDVDPAQAAEQFYRSMVGDDVWHGLPAAARRARRAEGAAMVAELRHQHERRYDAAGIAVPVLAGVGECSGPRTRRAARLTAAEAPAGRLVVVAGAAHGAPASHPDEIAG
ncbi:MAG TPA: hypothetical protein DEP66_05600, partial [Acidimicrobiaceae bacterium]|nr:hypothetical protein [Acidimicrobiaceae bacterium]